ncbi:MAG: NUDIX domain-containing protein [Thiotrichales bacterium]
MVWKPRAIVACVIEQDGKFLMVEEEANGVMVIGQPAGHVEHGETIIQAAKREVLEETGYLVEPTGLLSVMNRHSDDPDRTVMRFNFIARLVRKQEGTIIDPDIQAVHWLSDEDIINERQRPVRSESISQALEQYRQGVNFPLKLFQSIGFPAD